MGAIRTLSEIYFQEVRDDVTDVNGKLRARVMQALSAMIRSHDMAEQVFCQTEQAVALLESGLGLTREEPTVLCQRSLFLLRALLTSDSSDRERIQQFAPCLVFTVDNFARASANDELRELALGLVHQILEQGKSANAILARKNDLVSRAVERVATLRAPSGDEKDYASVELEQWESILVLLARATPDSAGPPLMLPPSTTPSMPQ